MTKPTLTTTVISDLAWEQLTNMDAPANSPVASTVAGVAPVQSWEETDQILPDIGQVDNELLAAAGLSNTILISVKTEEVLKTITVSIGDNGNWFVGGEDTGVPAKGTDEATIARPTGVYGVASVFHVGNTLTIGAGLLYCVKEGQNFFTMQTTAELNILVDSSTTFITIDRTGTVRTYSSGVNLWTIPESQALVALVIDTDGVVNSFAVPTVHNAMLMASAVIPYSQSAVDAAGVATQQATAASQLAGQARLSAAEAEAAKVITNSDALITTTNAQLTEQWKNEAQSAATSAHEFADFADADRVATAADRTQVAADKAAVAADKGIVATDKTITLGYKNDAAASKNLAAEYAIKPENSVITGTVSDYSALHWAQKAQQWAQVVSSALVWKGQWSAASNTAPPTPAVGAGAHFYRISAAGTINSVTYEVGDYIHWDTVNLAWFKIDGTDAVMTVNNIAPVGGNVSITTITGNAATATKLATARTIAGKLFDGTANITLAAADVGAVPTSLLEAGSGQVMRADGPKVALLEAAIANSPFRNKVHNGKFEVAQRGAVVPIPVLATAGTIDRFSVTNSSAARGVVEQAVVDASYPNTAIRKCMKLSLSTVTEASLAAGTNLRIEHVVEGYDIRDLVGSPFVLSFRAKSSRAGTYSVAIRNTAKNKTIVFEYTLAADTWQLIQIPIAALTGFMTEWETGAGLRLCWTLVAASDLMAPTTNTVLDGNFLGGPSQVIWGRALTDTFQLTEIQLERGLTKTEFDHRPYSVELALCQRFLMPIGWDGGSSGTLATGGLCTSSLAIVSLSPTVPLRDTPVFEGGTLSIISGGGAIGTGAVSITRRGPTLMFSQAMTGAAGQSCYLNTSQPTGFRGFSAELN